MSVLDNFDVIEAPRTYSIAEVRILKNRISFNIATASEIGYPAFVRVFISHDKTQLALQPCDKTASNAMRFFTLDGEGKKKRRSIGVGNRALATMIKSGMGWDMSQAISVPGVRFTEENVIIFDMKQAAMPGEKVSGETGLCVIPRPAAPFWQLPSQYFGASREIVLDADGRMVV